MKGSIILLFFIILLISPIYGISNIQITPDHPKIGDTVTITGKANPNEKINCNVSFEVDPPVFSTYYLYTMNDVKIPTMPNNFKVIAENVKNLYVSVKMGIWITKSAIANSNGIAIVSQSNVPIGTYDIKIGGQIKDLSKPVKLKIVASTAIKADESGNFKYSYKVDNIPAGTIVQLDIGGVKKEFSVGSDIPIPEPSNDTQSVNNKTNSQYSNEEINTTNYKNIVKYCNNSTKIIILSPTKNIVNSSPIVLNMTIESNRTYSVYIFLNSKPLSYTIEDNHYVGKLYLKNGINILEIALKDNKGNINYKKILKIEYINISNTSGNKIEYTMKLTENEQNIKNSLSNTSKNNYTIKKTIIKNINGYIYLVIKNGTIINKNGEINIKKINIPNTTFACYISPKDAEFTPPLILTIKFENQTLDDKIEVLFYNSSLKSWVSIPYKIRNNTIIIQIKNSGYYAIKLNEMNQSSINRSHSATNVIKSILVFLKAIIIILIDKFQQYMYSIF
ncbi:MAG: hypothetical protein GXN95_04515 [Methanococci archaeon]|nr:hypothetical protein [Methanococci archaeon]